MQVETEELKYQQMVLKHLGFYKGPIDGIWSNDTITAKKQFEFKREFSPAIPNNGLPFSLHDRLPKGLHYQRAGNKMFLHAKDLNQVDIDRMLGKSDSSAAVREPEVSNDGPVIEAPVEKTEASVEVAEVKEAVEVKAETPAQTNQQQHNQQKRPHQHPHGQRR